MNDPRINKQVYTKVCSNDSQIVVVYKYTVRVIFIDSIVTTAFADTVRNLRTAAIANKYWQIVPAAERWKWFRLVRKAKKSEGIWLVWESQGQTKIDRKLRNVSLLSGKKCYPDNVHRFHETAKYVAKEHYDYSSLWTSTSFTLNKPLNHLTILFVLGDYT